VTSVVLLFAKNLVINVEWRREDGTVTMMSGTYPWSSGNDSHCEWTIIISTRNQV
jgi:hypothetical protein